MSRTAQLNSLQDSATVAARCQWAPPPAEGKDVSLAALAAEVHLWSFSLAASETKSRSDFALLSHDEVGRAQRFRRKRDRCRFAAGRAAMRRILARYLECNPAELAFDYGSAGKPALAAPWAAASLAFNLSHSEDQGVLALTCNREVGVDLERIRAARDLPALARRFFAPGEVAALAEFDSPLFEQAFFTCWTRKEALLKAFGSGLQLPLDGFCVSVDPEKAAQLLSTEFRPAEAQRWSLSDVVLDPSAGRHFRSALAVEGSLPDCRYFLF